MAGYPYQALTGIDIRLLDLLPGSRADPVRCSMRHAPLQSSTNFQALSYTWGDLPDSERIAIDGHVVAVRPNLFSALIHLRQVDATRTLWIDAVTINQQDVPERNRQVLRMQNIYALATSVHVWLGEVDADDEAALALVQSLASVVEDAERLLDTGTQNAYVERWHPQFEAAPPATIRALNNIFNRPWWNRVWIIQEVSLARQSEARVQCGTTSLPWLHFLVVAYAIEECWQIVNQRLWLEFPDDALSGFLGGIRLAQCRYSDASRPQFRLLELLTQHREGQATNARDHIYGLLGLSGDIEEFGIQPDYSSDVVDVYVDFVTRIVNATHSLDVLCACRGERNFTALPSWVPDWSTDAVVPGICIYERYCGGDIFPRSPISHFQRYRAAGAQMADIAFEGSRLRARGVWIGRVCHLGALDEGMQFDDTDSFGLADEDGKSASGSDTFDSWLNLILDCPIWPRIEERYGSSSSVLDAFCRTLVANRNNRMTIPPAENDDSDASVDVDADDETSNDADMDDEVSTFETSEAAPDSRLFDPSEMLSMTSGGFKACLQVSWGKRLAILDNGYVGIVPGHAVVGDYIAILLGCSLPVVLRKGEEDSQLLGECYFYSLSEGELWQEDNSLLLTQVITLV
jgi:hypothetical protein